MYTFDPRSHTHTFSRSCEDEHVHSLSPYRQTLASGRCAMHTVSGVLCSLGASPPKQECCRCDVQPNCNAFSSCGTTPSPPQKEMRLLCTLTQKVIYVKKVLECEYAQKHSMSPTIYDIPGLIIAIMF